MEQKMISEFDIKKLVGEVMKEGLTYTAIHTGELKAENEYLKEENTDLEKELKEAKAQSDSLVRLTETYRKKYDKMITAEVEAKEENKVLKEENAKLKQLVENNHKFTERHITFEKEEQTYTDIEKEIKTAKAENEFLKEKVKHLELQVLGHLRAIEKLQK
jgi:seryl-tRNA synthetase